MRRGGVVAAVAIGLVAAACGGDGDGAGDVREGNGRVRTGRAEVGATEWVAVFDTARDPNDLEQEQAGLLERVEGAILVAPAGCHEGLPKALKVDDGTYVLGVVALTKQQMEQAVDRAERDPIFRGQLTLLCGGS